jgi:glycolate oxidase FAD binding subunit
VTAPPPSADLDAFATSVGEQGPVTVVGGRRQWEVGGPPAPGTREVAAPVGVVSFDPAEMTVRVGAGTRVDDLDAALAEAGQHVTLPDLDGATVGGVVSVGHDDVRRLGRGPLRDAVLELRYVSADGRLVKAGGPTVKNVSGFDLCRLLVGSLGTLGLIGEAVLRTWPKPQEVAWLRGDVDPFDLHRRLYRPGAILWDGRTSWVLIEGLADEVDAAVDALAAEGMSTVDGPPALGAHRWSVDPALLPWLADESWPLGETGPFVAEVGVGVVHGAVAPPPAPLPAPVAELNHRLRDRFDPGRRLNPGRDVVAR